MKACTVLVFARAPVAGQVKTRLIPVLGAGAAVTLHQRLTLRAIESAREAAPAAVELWCTPDESHPWFEELARTGEVILRTQQGPDLGARMAHALDDALARTGRALLIGSDIAVMSAAVLRDAARRLAQGADVVVAPAEDGGYVLIGLESPQPRLFDGIHWGTSRVLADTLARARRASLRVAQLPALWDVDTPADLARLALEQPDLLCGLLPADAALNGRHPT